ncbi:hypothetical protein SEPCBS119000_005762 [Sporothrix epigloea]|uniref:Uncharacterized protein n=1 Tax=Sporothrix epigloea TaxID=1892477 RepID=A0ABP0DZA7_9PEZI
MAVSNANFVPWMDQSAGGHFTAPAYPPWPSLPHLRMTSSSPLQPHRRGSSASTSSHSSRYRHQQQQLLLLQQQQQLQQQLLLCPHQIVSGHQLPFHQQPAYRHQNMHDPGYGSHGPAPSSRNPSVKQSGVQNQVRGFQRSYSLPHAPPTSQKQSSSSSYSSGRQLSALHKQQLQLPAQTWTRAPSQTKTQAPGAASATHLQLLSTSSLLASSHKSHKPNEVMPQRHQTKQQHQLGTVGAKLPSRRPKEGRNRGPVDANELAQRLHRVLTQRELASAIRANSSAHSLSSRSTASPAPPLNRQNASEQVQDQASNHRSGQRIRSRGSGNLRAAYASNGSMPNISSSATQPGSNSGPIRRQPYSAPHLGVLVPPPSLQELERRQRRTHSLSPQQVCMYGGAGGSAVTQRRAAIHHSMHPNPQAPRAWSAAHQPMLAQQPKQPYHHNQRVGQRSPPLLAKSPALSSPSSGGSEKAIQHGDGKAAEVSSVHANAVGGTLFDVDVEPGAKIENAESVAATQDDQRQGFNRTPSADTSMQCKKQNKSTKDGEKREKQKKSNSASDPAAAKQMRPLWRLKARLSSFSKDKLLSAPTVTVVALDEAAEEKEDRATDASQLADEIPRAHHVESTTVEEVRAVPSVPNAAEFSPKMAVVVGEQPVSPSSSVQSFASLAKSSSFLSRFRL